jgi:hypothetical protein
MSTCPTLLARERSTSHLCRSSSAVELWGKVALVIGAVSGIGVARPRALPSRVAKTFLVSVLDEREGLEPR